MRFLLLMVLGISLQIFPQNSYGTWEWTGDTNDTLWNTEAIKLLSGEVLMGGVYWEDPQNPHLNFEIYDPASGLWRQTGSPNNEGVDALLYGLTLLSDGLIFAVTSWTGEFCELFDPLTETWTLTAPLPVSVSMGAAVFSKLTDDRIIFAGGISGGSNYDSSYVYDYATETWSFSGRMNRPRNGAAAITLDDGRVFVTGGAQEIGVDTRTCEVYNPNTNNWVLTDSMMFTRTKHALLKLSNGKVLIIGGQIDFGNTALQNLIEIYDPQTNQIDSLGQMTTGKSWYNFACELPGNRIFIADCLPLFEINDWFRWEIFDIETGSTIFWDYGLDPTYRFPDFIVLPEHGHQVLSLGSIHFPWEIGFPTKKVALFTPAFVPVEMAVFTADVLDADVVLNWTTATETNNNGFYVERDCKDDPGWKEVGYVEGNGTTTELCSYTFTDTPPAAGTYYYRLRQVDFDGTTEYSSYVEATVTAPTEFALHQNYPNPFNPATLISYSLPEAAEVRLTVFNQTGEQIAMLYNGMQEAGLHKTEWSGMEYPSGVYYVRLEAGQFTESIKMMLLK